jgi:hypothetical protein
MAVCLHLLHCSKLLYNLKAALTLVSSTTFCVTYIFQKRSLLKISTKELITIPGFHASVKKNCALLAYYTAVVVIPYRHFGTTFLSVLKVRPTSFHPKTSASNYHNSMRNKPEERSSFLKTDCLNKSSVISFRYFSHIL